ncbi:unnamed protein product [Rotaria sordida]|uniref:Hepatocyte growth factor-regulated tyrosine kinase substrate n=1 Tax=Rotaria sordida TaxID=392033 RepID=A0A819DKS9_9BILA|nr:unnamed protein product [Rotaria sordida]CAF3825478.1 unnamed protein product [Rotaria sordida]
MFDKLLAKATSPLLLEPDWESILQLCDIVKTQEVTPKYTIQSIKKKFRHENAHVILNSLQCLESIVKNCGGSIHKEVAQKDMMDALKELAKNGPEQIRDKILELIQCWSYGLGQEYKIFTDTYNLMKLENYHFPPLKESEVMFENNDIAPEWRDDKECFRCRQIFTTFIRKHHCRACGNIFCDKCSSKSCPIPKFGIDRDVRVCDSCYEKLTTGVPLTSKPISSLKPAPTIIPNQTKTQAEIDEEESFQLALAISQSEADEKERQKKVLTQKYAMSTLVSAPKNISENDNQYTELNKYIERGQQNIQEIISQIPEQTDNFISDREIDQFTNLVTDHINNFKFRMLSNQQRNRNITIDTAVQSVFVMLQHLHPELHRFMQLLEDKRAYYENLQDKLTQLKDAREALNALRTEHYERKQQETLERERQRQIQLAQKLDFMRQKKQEYLEYQRQIHLQHLAQQELEMKTRLEQQRQLTLAREQLSQNPHLSMISTDFSQLPYQQPYITLPTQQSQYTSMIKQPPNTHMNFLSHTPSPLLTQPIFCPVNVNTDNNYMNLSRQIPLNHSIASYNQQHQQQSVSMSNQSKSEPQLIIFD